jgi:hypothetical protein
LKKVSTTLKYVLVKVRGTNYGVVSTVLLHLATIPLAIAYAHVLEWVMHKYVLHGLGKKKDSLWSSHWHKHHRACRKNKNYDGDYLKGIFYKNNIGEVLGLIGLGALHYPIAPVAPLLYLTLGVMAVRYYLLHKKAHLDVEWGKKNLPWHHDHHMGKNQNANWGVTNQWVDCYMGTRIEYLNNN